MARVRDTNTQNKGRGKAYGKRCFFFFHDVDVEEGGENWRSKVEGGQNLGRGGRGGSLANYFYSFPRNEFRSRRERERERNLFLSFQDAEEI